MSFAPMLLAFALLGGSSPAASTPAVTPAPACASVARTGTFRIVTKHAGNTAVGQGLVVLENINGCLEAMFITDATTPAEIEKLDVRGDTLEGTLELPDGQAKVQLKFAGATVAGSIVEGHNAWTVEGRKTS